MINYNLIDSSTPLETKSIFDERIISELDDIQKEDKKITKSKSLRFVTDVQVIKKVNQIAQKVIAAVVLIKKEEVSLGLKNVSACLKFYADVFAVYDIYQDIKFWVRYFNPQYSVSLNNLKVFLPENEAQMFIEEKKRGAKKRTFKSTKEFESKIKDFLSEKKLAHSSFDFEGIKKIAVNENKVPLPLLFSKICFSIGSAANTASLLKNYGIIDLSLYVAKLGNRFPVIKMIAKFTSDSLLSKINIVGMTVILGFSSYQLIKNIHTYCHLKKNHADEALLKKELNEIKRNSIKTISTAIDLSTIILPMVFAFNPPALIALSLVSKGTGLIKIWLLMD